MRGSCARPIARERGPGRENRNFMPKVLLKTTRYTEGKEREYISNFRLRNRQAKPRDSSPWVGRGCRFVSDPFFPLRSATRLRPPWWGGSSTSPGDKYDLRPMISRRDVIRQEFEKNFGPGPLAQVAVRQMLPRGRWEGQGAGARKSPFSAQRRCQNYTLYGGGERPLIAASFTADLSLGEPQTCP